MTPPKQMQTLSFYRLEMPQPYLIQYQSEDYCAHLMIPPPP